MIYHHTNLVICGGLQMIIANQSFDLYFYISLYLVDCIFIFLTASSLVYLFHYLARKKYKAVWNEEKDQHLIQVRKILKPAPKMKGSDT